MTYWGSGWESLCGLLITAVSYSKDLPPHPPLGKSPHAVNQPQAAFQIEKSRDIDHLNALESITACSRPSAQLPFEIKRNKQIRWQMSAS